MARRLFAAGIDPGFATMGLAMVEIFPEPDQDRVEFLNVFRTMRSDKKRKVLAADDNVRRARELLATMKGILDHEDLVAICAESMSFPRNSSCAAKLAMSWGIIITLAELHDLPIIQATPKEIKKATTSKYSASKDEVERALKIKFGFRKGEPLELYRSVSKTFREHAWDALGAVVACQESEAIRLARKML